MAILLGGLLTLAILPWSGPAALPPNLPVSPSPASIQVTVPSPTPAQAPAQAPGPTRESSKDYAGLQAKVGRAPKIKECCGYPLGLGRSYKMTFYWLAWEAEYANEPYDTEIYTRQGFPIGRYPRTFVYELKLEGSGILRDGRVINYDGECGYGVGICFRQMDPAEHPLGMGGQARPLQPFRSVAVDPRYIPIGTPLYIRELVGIRMPDGTEHDGCVRADDTGGGIRKRELDFFVESYANYKYIADNLWNDTAVTPLIEEPRCAYLRSGDPLRERGNDHTDWLVLHQPRPRQTLARTSTGSRRAPGRAVALRSKDGGKGHGLALKRPGKPSRPGRGRKVGRG